MYDELSEMVVDHAEAIEAMDSIEELDPLDVQVTAALDGSVREITLILTVGGPHIEVNATKGTVSGYWGGESHTTHCNTEVLDDAHSHYRMLFNEDRL